MSYADTISREARRVVVAQTVLTLIAAAGFGVMADRAAALAAMYGGTVTVLLTLWLAWRVKRAGSRFGGLASIYSGAIARYALAALGIGVGIGFFRLSPLPLLSAFAVTQFGFLVLWRRPPGTRQP